MEPYQLRVLDEREDLNGRLTKLHNFLEDSSSAKDLPNNERDLLLSQRDAMRSYLNCLDERIAIFVENGELVHQKGETETTPEDLGFEKHADGYRPNAWKDYTYKELEMWVHLLRKRAEHRTDEKKKQKDLYDADNYEKMMLECVGNMSGDEVVTHALQQAIGTVCVCSTGRLGVVTHVDTETFSKPFACGFGLDGKGTWISSQPICVAIDPKEFFIKLRNRFGGALTSPYFTDETVDRIARRVVELGEDGIDEVAYSPTSEA